MHALLTKEFRLVVHPATYMLVVLGALVLIPSWPYAVIILYGILMAFFNVQNAREMRDLSYSFALPVSRRDMVRARVLVMIIIELAMTAIMALCICLRPVLGIDAVAATQPMVGLPANIALLGFTLATFGIFNLVFFALYFRNPAKIGVLFLLACIPVTVFGVAFEAVPFIPVEVCALISTPGFGNLAAQLIVLFVGIALFVALSAFATRLAPRAFATYDA